MAETLQPVPFDAELVPGQLAKETWLTWFFNLARVVSSVARRIIAVKVTDQAAAIATSPIPTGSLSSGQYRISFYLRLTQAANPGPSSAQVTLNWIDGGVVVSKTFALVNGNTTASVDANSLTVDADAPGVLTYAVSYASVGATPAKFKLTIIVEAL